VIGVSQASGTKKGGNSALLALPARAARLGRP
jgi:hypothetical protein